MRTITELAQRRAETAEIVRTLGMVNTPTSWEDRVKLDARYRIAMDAMMQADQDYRVALALLPKEELAALAR